MEQPRQFDPSVDRVRDWAGHVVWRVTVPSGEQTCLDCGETLPVGAEYCWRCVGDDDDDAASAAKHNPRLVATTSYLRPGEYEMIR